MSFKYILATPSVPAWRAKWLLEVDETNHQHRFIAHYQDGIWTRESNKYIKYYDNGFIEILEREYTLTELTREEVFSEIL